MSLDMNMNDGTIFQFTIKRWIGNTIYKSVTFSWIVPIRATNTTNKDKIV